MPEVHTTATVTEYDIEVMVVGYVSPTSYDPNRLVEVEMTEVLGLNGQEIPDITVLMSGSDFDYCRDRLANA
jgi:hypothetical protein